MANAEGPFTILQLFDQDLPRLDRPPDSKYVSLSHGGPAAESPLCLRFLVCDKIKPLLDTAEEALRRGDLRSQDRVNFAFSTATSMYTLRSQIEVATTSTVFVLGYTWEILCIMYPKQWRHHCEVTPSSLVEENSATNQGSGIISGAENLQYNFIFDAVDSKGIRGHTIAILEIKKPDMLKYLDYEKALIANTATSAKVAEAKAVSASASSLVRNAKVHTAQLYETARKHECSHAAIFNWDNLLLHVFDVDSGDASSLASDQTGITWAYEAGEGGAFMEKCTLRKAMLGWLLRAFQDHFGPSSAM